MKPVSEMSPEELFLFEQFLIKIRQIITEFRDDLNEHLERQKDRMRVIEGRIRSRMEKINVRYPHRRQSEAGAIGLESSRYGAREYSMRNRRY